MCGERDGQRMKIIYVMSRYFVTLVRHSIGPISPPYHGYWDVRLQTVTNDDEIPLLINRTHFVFCFKGSVSIVAA